MEKDKKDKVNVEIKYNFQPIRAPQYVGTLKGNAYPYFLFKFTNPVTKQSMDWYPSWDTISLIIQQLLLHEKRLDIVMGRPRESQKYYEMVRVVLDNIKNNEIAKTKEELKKELDELYDQNVFIEGKGGKQNDSRTIR